MNNGGGGQKWGKIANDNWNYNLYATPENPYQFTNWALVFYCTNLSYQQHTVEK